MGFFDKLIKTVVNDVLDNVIDNVSSNHNNDNAQHSHTVDPTKSHSCQTNIERHDKAYFKTILEEEFAQYAIKENVPVSEIEGEGRSYDFGLYRNGQLIAVVVLVEHNRDNNKAYKDSKMFAQKAGIPFINFYMHMPNKPEFVKYRINNMIK